MKAGDTVMLVSKKTHIHHELYLKKFTILIGNIHYNLNNYNGTIVIANNFVEFIVLCQEVVYSKKVLLEKTMSASIIKTIGSSIIYEKKLQDV